MAIPEWIMREMEAVDANWKVTKAAGMGSRVGPESQVRIEVTMFDSAGNPVEAVMDGQVVIGRESILRIWAMAMLRSAGIDVDSPRKWRRVNKKKEPKIIGGI